MHLSAVVSRELSRPKSEMEAGSESAEIRERQAALKAAEAAAARYGFALEEITGGNQRGGGKKQKAAAKYRNPNNPEETWSGRGRKPHWVHAALTAGMDISDLEI